MNETTSRNKLKARVNHQNLFRAYHILLSVFFFLLGLGMKLTPVLMGREDQVGWKIFGEFGTFIALIFSIHFAYEIFVRRFERQIFINEVQAEIAGSLKYFLQASEDFEKSGLQAYYLGLPTPELFEKIKQAKRIQMLQTWTGLDNTATEAFKIAIKNGCQIKILLLDPESPHCDYRNSDLHEEEQHHVKTHIKSNLTWFSSLASGVSDISKIEIKTYFKATPTIPMYFVDDKIYLGSTWRGKHNYSVNTPYLKVNRYLSEPEFGKSKYGDLADQYFDDIWENFSETYPKTSRPISD